MAEREILARHSYNELLDLLEWFNNQGNIPTLIGGWAVFLYNSYIGSVDIDIVGPRMGGLFYNCIEGFERLRGYEEYSGDPLMIQRQFRKSILEEGHLVGYMEIDACSFEDDPGEFHANPGIFLPYRISGDEENRRKIVIEGREVYLPKKHLLILYKIKAMMDRRHDLATKGAILSSARREWLRAKVLKDGSDVIAILDPSPPRKLVEESIDYDMLTKIAEQQRIKQALKSVADPLTMNESLAMYPYANNDTLREWIKPLVSIFTVPQE